MTVVALSCVRSCGVTTLAAGLAMLWPGGGCRVLVEADPAGGTLAAVAGLSVEPGLVSLAAAARRHADPDQLFEHAQSLADGTPVVCAPPAADLSSSALGMLGALFDRFGGLDGLVVVDCGRLPPGASSFGVFDRADLGVLACRPQLADLNALAAFLGAGERAVPPVVVLVGPGPYPPGEISATLGVEVAGTLPWDPDAAGVLGALAPSSRQLTRAPLVRALRSLAVDLAVKFNAADRTEAAPAATAAVEPGCLVEAAP